MAGNESDRFVIVNKRDSSNFSFSDWNKSLKCNLILQPIAITFFFILKTVNFTFGLYFDNWTLFYSDLKPSSVAIIREVYDSENAHIKFEMELERALEAGVSVIVIEPESLGEETARWIYVGNLLHKVSVYSGLCGIASGLTWSSLACAPFGVVSVLCAGCYTLSWQWDPCCKYQEEKNRRHLSTLPVLSDLTSASPVVLVRTDNRRKIYLHSSISIAAAAVCLWRLYQTFK